MQTLRGFVEAVLGTQQGKTNYFSKPDRISATLELRRLQSRGRPSVHFYEYYWAHSISDTRLRAVLIWIVRLPFRRWKNIPSSSRSLILLTWLVVAGISISLASGIVAPIYRWYTSLTKFGALWFSASIPFWILAYFLTRYLGDAARYLDPQPENVQIRQKIRSEGISFLRALHEKRDYDRIVIVGHSLGSVIGYDIMSRYWQECSETLPISQRPDIQINILNCQKRKIGIQNVLTNLLPRAAQALNPSVKPSSLDIFQNMQKAALREEMRLGLSWRITDFITLGSPLAHSMLLLASNAEDFDTRKLQRELPTCPPQLDVKGFGYVSDPVNIGGGKKFSPIRPHHAALFAVTRWTNLYFPARFGLFGDFIGGPLAPYFGSGVRDRRLRSTGTFQLLRNHTILSHTKYWDCGRRRSSRNSIVTPAEKQAIEALRAALSLEERTFGPEPWPK